MIERIKQLLHVKNLSASQFADKIGVQRSSVSHVLSGRNKPSLEFVQKILLAYPEISSDWILFGTGLIIKQKTSVKPPDRKEDQKDFLLSPEVSNQYTKDNQNSEDRTDQIDPNEEIQSDEFEMIPGKNHQSDSLINDSLDRLTNHRQKKIAEKIVILYKDQTFSEYYPES